MMTPSYLINLLRFSYMTDLEFNTHHGTDEKISFGHDLLERHSCHRRIEPVSDVRSEIGSRTSGAQYELSDFLSLPHSAHLFSQWRASIQSRPWTFDILVVKGVMNRCDRKLLTRCVRGSKEISTEK